MSRPVERSGSEAVPKAMLGCYQAAAALTDAFCAEHLNVEYATLARRALAALCRKRPSPLLSGNASSWACGIIYALGRANFLSDKSSSPFISTQDLCAGFRVSPSTGASKAKTVRDALGIEPWDHRWLLAENLASLSPVWLLEVDGLLVDIRAMPRPFQIAAYERGLIPYVPADGPDGDGGARQEILERYDSYRRINAAHQTAFARRLLQGPAAKIAVRLGLIGNEGELGTHELEDVAPALDLALYGAENGTTAVQLSAREIRNGLSSFEARVLDGMCFARFSIFRVSGCHRGAGVDLTDVISGEQVWVVDRGLEASAHAGAELALRLFQPDDFWMTTGIVVVVDSGLWRLLESEGVILRRSLPMPSLDRNILAEAVYRLAEKFA